MNCNHLRFFFLADPICCVLIMYKCKIDGNIFSDLMTCGFSVPLTQKDSEHWPESVVAAKLKPLMVYVQFTASFDMSNFTLAFV